MEYCKLLQTISHTHLHLLQNIPGVICQVALDLWLSIKAYKHTTAFVGIHQSQVSVI